MLKAPGKKNKVDLLPPTVFIVCQIYSLVLNYKALIDIMQDNFSTISSLTQNKSFRSHCSVLRTNICIPQWKD